MHLAAAAAPVAVGGRQIASHDLQIRSVPARTVPHDLSDSMIALAGRSLPGLDAGAYVRARLACYERALVATAAGRITAFVLVDDAHEVRGAQLVYVGPLFSERSAYLPLFVALVRELLARRRPFHVLAEVQCPKIVLAFEQLFWRSALPRLDGSAVPDDARVVARAFARSISHMGALDEQRMATRADGGTTLYVPRPGYEPVTSWLERRGVVLARGDSQLLLVSCLGTRAERARLSLEMSAGAAALRDYASAKRRMLARFEGGAR